MYISISIYLSTCLSNSLSRVCNSKTLNIKKDKIIHITNNKLYRKLMTLRCFSIGRSSYWQAKQNYEGTTFALGSEFSSFSELAEFYIVSARINVSRDKNL